MITWPMTVPAGWFSLTMWGDKQMLTGRGRSSKSKINNYYLLVIKNKINIPIHMVLRQRKNKAKACADWKRGKYVRQTKKPHNSWFLSARLHRTFKRETKLGSIIWWIFRNDSLYKLCKHHEMKLLKRFGSLKINKRLIHHFLVIISNKRLSNGWSVDIGNITNLLQSNLP